MKTMVMIIARGKWMQGVGLQEAADNSISTYDEASAIEWANGYKFPKWYMKSDEKCMQAAQLSFVKMV